MDPETISGEAVEDGATPGEEQGVGETQSVESAGNPFEDRIRNDPDFAIEQVKKHQREAHRAQEERKQILNRMGEVAPLMDQLGNDSKAVLDAVSGYAKAAANPAMRNILDNFHATGQLPTTGQSNDDPYNDPYAEPESGQVTALQQQLHEMNLRLEQMGSQIVDTRVKSSQQAIGDYLQELSKEYPEELFENILKPELKSQLEIWEKDPVGRKTLETLNKDTLDLVKARIMDKNFDAFARAHVAKQSRQLQSASTGSPPGVTTTPASKAPQVGGKGWTVADAFAEAERRAKNGTLDPSINYDRGFGG